MPVIDRQAHQLDLLKTRGRFSGEQFERPVGRISFFVNSGIRFVEEICKMRAFAEMWEDITADGDALPIFLTSARTGAGIGELRDAIADQIAGGPVADRAARDRYFLERWVKEEWGRAGLAHLRAALGGAGAALERAGDLDAAAREFAQSFRRAIGART